MDLSGLKVGEVARRTGLTVRTLHHYDELGLVSPSARTAAGHRIYTDGDLALLQAVSSLKQLGFSLVEISGLLRDPPSALGPILEAHLAATADRITNLQRLTHRLEALATRLRRGAAPTLELLLEATQETTMQEPFFTPEQAARLRSRQQKLASQLEWRAVALEMKAVIERGASPTSREVRALAEKWHDLKGRITQNDEGIDAALTAYYRADPDAAAAILGPGITRQVLEFAGQAVKALLNG
jgi:MerR family transcriptional regulator, thiopeptide resistance regulator